MFNINTAQWSVQDTVSRRREEERRPFETFMSPVQGWSYLKVCFVIKSDSTLIKK